VSWSDPSAGLTSEHGGLPRLALRLHGGLHPARCVELARIAEEAGFHGVWFAENLFERGVLPAATACAVATRRIRIGIGVFNPYNRHPTLMAMEMGALDEIAGGRAVLGIGAGVPSTLRQIGCEYQRPLSAVREAVMIVRALLAGEEVTQHGRVFVVDRVRLGHAAPLRLPIFVAAMTERALHLCGEVGDGLIVGNMCPPAFTGHALRLMQTGAEAAGREGRPEVVKYVPCAVGEDGPATRRVVKHAIGRMLGSYWQAYADVPPVRSAIFDSSGIESAQFSDAMRRLAGGDSAEAALDDRFVAAYAVAGTAQECVEQLRVHRRAGVTEMAVSCGGDDPGATVRALGEAVGAGNGRAG